MTAECPSDLFKEFEKCVGDFATPKGEEGALFLYTALGEHSDFSNLTHFVIPKLDDETFRDWMKFENWCDDIRNGFMHEILDEESESFLSAYENSTPEKFFHSKSLLNETIVSALTDGASEANENIIYVEIQCNGKKLVLLYFDPDAWALGFGESVLVAKSLAELTKDKGYYPLS